ncbi:MAG: SagB family peptide dehydrogenase [Pseudomonadota bacterium]
MAGHALDWANQPTVFKAYPDLPVLPLPGNDPFSEILLSQILRAPGSSKTPFIPSQGGLSQILQLTYSLTAKAGSADSPFYYRSVASAGALYPTELYLATPGLPDLKEGLYHYSIGQAGLSPLREGNFTSFIQKTALWPEGFCPGLTFLFSAIFFRSAWKYRDRAFRYHLLDTGHVIENLLLALRAQKLPISLTYDFGDPDMDRFLGVDKTLEGTLALISIPETSPGPGGKPLAIPELADSFKGASRVAQQELSSSLIQEFYQAGWETPSEKRPPGPGSLTSDSEAITWAPVIPPEVWPEKLTYAQAVHGRRSKRNFVPAPLSSQTFGALLEGLSLDIPGLVEVPENSNSFLSLGLLTGTVEGVLPGFYLLNKTSLQVGMVKQGQFIKHMARICLDQMWLANAALHFLFLANLDFFDLEWGPRGYRYAMMTAGRMGERLYLISSALGLGCCGIGAFYDQEAADLLGLDEGNCLLYLVAVGSIKHKIFNEFT